MSTLPHLIPAIGIAIVLLVPGCWSLSPINIAWMANEPFIYYFNASTSIGSLAYSIQEIENDTNLLPGYYFDAKYKNSNCNSMNGLGSFWDFLLNRTAYPIHLVVGPVCTGAMNPVALLASYLNIPVLGWISSDPPVADKTVYTTLLRFLWPISNIGEGVVLLMKEFDWKLMSIISTAGGDYDVLASSVRSSVLSRKSEGFEVDRWVQNVPVGASEQTILDSLNTVKSTARIILLVYPEDEMTLWAYCIYQANMHKGEYVFIYTNQATPQELDLRRMTNTSFWQKGNANDTEVSQALGNYFMMFAKTESHSQTTEYLANFSRAAQWNSNYWPKHLGLPYAYPDFYSMFLYDAMKVYSRFANQLNLTNDGEAIFQAARGSVTAGGATGDIILSDTNDRIANYYIMHMNSSKKFDFLAQTIAVLNHTTLQRSIEFLDKNNPILWGNGEIGKRNAPPDRPDCGFDGSKCPPYALYIAPAVVVLVILLAAIIGYKVYRKIRYERELADMSWKINYDDVVVYTGGAGAGSRLNFRSKSMNLRKSKGSITDSLDGQLFITVANYRGNMAAIRTIHVHQKVKVERDLLQEMRNMTEIKHNNLNTFLGACTDPPHVCVAWEYCTKGSLQDVIWNDNITLDDMFKFSIAIDVLKGLSFIHSSELKLHGKLKSNNVVIDGRWACKLSDYGLTVFTHGEEDDPELSDHQKYAKLLWTAPEDLRNSPPESYQHMRSAAPSGDVFGAGIILKEVFCRNGPYSEHEELDPQDMVKKLADPPDDIPFRPTLTELPGSLESERSVGDALCDLVTECLNEDPKLRPTSAQALKTLTHINPFKKSNVMDNMIAMMEKYSSHLEEIVAERTLQLDEEKKKTEVLLYRMLPRPVAEDLKMGRNVEAESFDQVTIYFSDIPGFSAMVAKCTPFQVVDILNGIYGLMDDTIPLHDVYKVETVNDVYVMVSGLPVRNGDRHIVEVANCALDLLSGALSFQIPHRPNEKMAIRIGINTGPIVTGVVGLTSPRYCLFGDTMNTASRMESTGMPMRIHLSTKAYNALSQFSGYRLAERGFITVKGKGEMCTYWLMGREGWNKPLPNFEQEFKKDKTVPKILPATSGKTLDKPRPMRISVESGYSENTTGSNPASRKTSLDQSNSTKTPGEEGEAPARKTSLSQMRKISTDAIRKTSIAEEPPVETLKVPDKEELYTCNNDEQSARNGAAPPKTEILEFKKFESAESLGNSKMPVVDTDQ